MIRCLWRTPKYTLVVESRALPIDKCPRNGKRYHFLTIVGAQMEKKDHLARICKNNTYVEKDVPGMSSLCFDCVAVILVCLKQFFQYSYSLIPKRLSSTSSISLIFLSPFFVSPFFISRKAVSSGCQEKFFI